MGRSGSNLELRRFNNVVVLVNAGSLLLEFLLTGIANEVSVRIGVLAVITLYAMSTARLVPMVSSVGSPVGSKCVLVVPVVSAYVTLAVVVGICVLTLHNVNGVSAGELLFVSLGGDHPSERVLTHYESAGVANAVVIGGVYVLALVLYRKMVASCLVPVLSFVVVPILVVSAVAHYVSADITLSVVGFCVILAVNVSASARFLGVVTAARFMIVLGFGSRPLGLKGVNVIFLISAYALTVNEGVSRNLGSVGLSVVSAGERTPMSVFVTEPFFAFLVYLRVSTGNVAAYVAYTVVILVDVNSLVCIRYSVVAGGSVPMLFGIA